METLKICQQKIIKAVYAFENGLSINSLYNNPGNPLNMGKTTVYKLRRLWREGKLKHLVHASRPNDLPQIFDNLWDLWDYGVEKLQGRIVQDATQVRKFIEDYEVWKELIVIELGKISPNLANDWEILGPTYGGPFPNAVNQEHRHYLMVVAERLDRLRELINWELWYAPKGQ